MQVPCTPLLFEDVQMRVNVLESYRNYVISREDIFASLASEDRDVVDTLLSAMNTTLPTLVSLVR